MSGDLGKTELDYATQFWSLANAITAFAIVQMITYLLSVGASDSKIRPGVIQIRPFVYGGIIVATLVYSMFVIMLGKWEIKLLEHNGVGSLSESLRWVIGTRVSGIVLFGAVGLVITRLLKREPDQVRRTD